MDKNIEKIERINDELKNANFKKAEKMLSPKMFGWIPAVDINATDKNGDSFLANILWSYNENMVTEKERFIDFLLDHGFNMNIQNKLGMTALYRYFFASDINVDLVEIVLKKGADPNIFESEYKLTPLIKAAERGLIECTKLLVEYNANIHHENSWGFTAIDYAKTYGTKEIVDFLASKGAKIKENANPPLKACGWHTWAETWEQLVELFIKREVVKRKPDLKGLYNKLKKYSNEERHAAWIYVAQALYKIVGNYPTTVSCYVEALNADSDPSSIAWEWLKGTYDESMSIFRTYEGAQPLEDQLLSVIKSRGIESIRG